MYWQHSDVKFEQGVLCGDLLKDKVRPSSMCVLCIDLQTYVCCDCCLAILRVSYGKTETCVRVEDLRRIWHLQVSINLSNHAGGPRPFSKNDAKQVSEQPASKVDLFTDKHP